MLAVGQVLVSAALDALIELGRECRRLNTQLCEVGQQLLVQRHQIREPLVDMPLVGFGLGSLLKSDCDFKLNILAQG